MDLIQYLRVLRKRWQVVVLVAALGLVGAGVGSALVAPKYSAQTQLFVSARSSADDASALLQGSNFTQQRVKSYADVMTSARILGPVVERLSLGETPRELAERVQASAPLDTVLINVKVEDTDPVRAADIANAVATQFILTVQDLERPAYSEPSPVKVSVVRDADVPTAPVSPRTKLNLALGLAVGLAVGAGLALLREILDTTIKSTDEVAALGVPALGTTINSVAGDRRSAIVDPGSYAPPAEALRQIRTNLQFVDVDNPPQVVVLSSSLPGEGKTTTAVNLALSMASAGVRTVLIEADLRLPKAAEVLGVERSAGLTTVLAGRADLDEVLQPYGDNDLLVLASGPIPPNPSELLGSRQMAELLATLRERADLVIIDSPPLLPVTDAAVLAGHADGVILVARHGRTTRDQYTKAVERLQAVDARVLGGVLSMVPDKGAGSGYGYGYGYGYGPEDVPETAPEAGPEAGSGPAPRPAPERDLPSTHTASEHKNVVPAQRRVSALVTKLTAREMRSPARWYSSAGRR